MEKQEIKSLEKVLGRTPHIRKLVEIPNTNLRVALDYDIGHMSYDSVGFNCFDSEKEAYGSQGLIQPILLSKKRASLIGKPINITRRYSFDEGAYGYGYHHGHFINYSEEPQFEQTFYDSQNKELVLPVKKINYSWWNSRPGFHSDWTCSTEEVGSLEHRISVPNKISTRRKKNEK